MAMLLYGAGLRLMECCRLRIKDIDFSRNQIVVRAGKGNKNRYTMLPALAKEPLLQQLQAVKRQHEEDLKRGSHYTDRVTGERRRHHLHESVLQKAVKDARLKASIAKTACPHTLRHSFATLPGSQP
jgi:site-specific recombinase XerD